jgi:vitamin B12 transporter
MKKEKNIWAIALLFALWWLVPNPINAQSDSLSLSTLQEVTVTATKFAKSQSETGKVLTIIDQDQLKVNAGKDLSQVLNEQVGLFINGANSNPGKDKTVYMRGAKGEYTLILLDGVPLNDPSSIGGGAYDLRLISLNQVERIEILKGNQSTLYGSNAIAGVINIISKKEGLKPITGTGTLSYGSFNTLRGLVNVSGGLSKLSYWVGGSRLSSNGISEAKDTMGNQNFDRDGYTQNAFNGSITLRPVKSLQIQPYFRWSEFDGGYDGGPFADSKNNYTSSLLNVGIHSEYNFQKGTLHVFYGYDKSNRDYEDNDYGVIYSYKGKFHHGEFFLNYDVNKKLQLLSGIGFQSWHMRDDAAIKPNPSVTLISPYASLFVRNVKGFSTEVGGRYNYHTEYGNNFTFSVNPSWMIRKSVKIFLSVSSGFKAPSLQQLYGQFGANPELKPEKSLSGEGGVQFFMKSNLDFRVVGFQRKIEAVIFYAFPEGYINQDKQVDHGVDVEGNWAINSQCKAKAFYSYVNGSIVSNGDSGPNNLYRIPRHTLGTTMSYQILKGWLISVNFKIVGKRIDVFYNSQTFTNDQVSLKAYQLLDFYTEVSVGKFKLFMDSKNLLNQNYFEVYGYSVLPLNVQGGMSLTL